jgi:septal ring factor EnvC (AmiA/AmiB activator)
MTCGPRLISCVILLAVFVYTVYHPRIAAAEDGLTEKYDIPIKRYEKNIQKLQSGIEIHLGKLQISGAKEYSLLDELEGIDRNLALQKIRLQVMEDRLRTQKELLIIKIREMKEAEQNTDIVSRHLQERLRAFYLMGKTGILNVTFSTRTLPELMLFNDSFTRLLEYDYELLEEYRETLAQLVLAKESHEKESALLDEYIAQARQEQVALDAAKKEKEQLLKRVKSEKGLYEQALKEMKTAESDLQKSLISLQEKKTYIAKGFAMNKGKMTPPVSGRVVLRYGEPLDDKKKSGETTRGITIDAKNGSPVRAIFAGKVIFAGYKRGYGNMVIIDHGLNYFSITSRLETLKVKTGDILDQGDTIGVAGDIATLFEKGLYFEIRNETEPVDPLEWISTQGLTGL